MDDQIKLIKYILIINIATIAAVLVLLGLQIFQSQKPAAGIPQGEIQKPAAGIPQEGMAPQGGQQTGGGLAGKCGDGTCDSIEKAAGVCPQDCQE